MLILIVKSYLFVIKPTFGYIVPHSKPEQESDHG